MRTIYIDCDGAKSELEIWQRYIDAANLERADLFGRNLNAFWDAIEHGGPGWPGEAMLVFRKSATLAKLTARDGSSLLDHFHEMAKEATQTQIKLL